MPPYAAWQSRPVFIASTFRGMLAGRDCLRARVIPELEERLRIRAAPRGSSTPMACLPPKDGKT
jgi:hypothetical protein